ncbi:acrosin-like [Penaeus monodon]|uniref:acrosin-like n=1 Tax=Penaeus monodon TaxID=6687 RepID=UPI0018A6E139|nr:acrosin-like [Penaeus monodon]
MKAGDRKIFCVRANMDVCAIFVHGDGSTELEMNCKTFELSACTKEYFFVQDQTSEKQFCGKKGPGKMTGIQALYLLYERAKRSKGRPRVWCSIEGVEPGGVDSGVDDGDEASSAVQAVGCDNVCGQAPAGAGATRIVGGAEADAGEYPWMARVDISLGSASMSCGGAIITATHVVTASHCVDSEYLEVTVRAGMHDLASYQENTTQVIKAKQVLLHPKFSPMTSANDIALLTLEEPLEWSAGVGPVCLPPDGDFKDRAAVVAGWGSLGANSLPHPQANDIALLTLEEPLEWSAGVGPVCLPPDGDFKDRAAVVAGWGSLGTPSLNHRLPPSTADSLPQPQTPSRTHRLPPSTTDSLPHPQTPSRTHRLPPSTTDSLPQPQTPSLNRRLPPSTADSLPHPQANDIALLTLEEPLEWSAGVGPVCLPPDGDFKDRAAVVAGWGSLGANGPYATKLNEVAVTITDQEMCEKAYSSSMFYVTDKHICAADPGKDACHGDSGGPLVIRENGKWVLIGIVSFGRGCAMQGFPGVYTRVSSYNTWLLKNMAVGSC